MPRDYRGGRTTAPRKAPRPRQAVTVTRCEPKPVAHRGPLGPYTDEHRAAFAAQGIKPGDGRNLHEAGISPDSLIDWTDPTVGVGLTDYPRMILLASAGVTPTAYATYSRAILTAGPVGYGSSLDREIVGYYQAGITPTAAARWENARHVRHASGTCYCPMVGAGFARSFTAFGKDPGWLQEALTAGCESVSTALSVAHSNVPLAMVRRIASRRPVYRATGGSGALREWKKWVQAADGDEGLAEAVADAAGTVATVTAWLGVDLPPGRRAALVRAGLTPAEARTTETDSLDDDDLAVLAMLSGMGRDANEVLAYV